MDILNAQVGQNFANNPSKHLEAELNIESGEKDVVLADSRDLLEESIQVESDSADNESSADNFDEDVELAAVEIQKFLQSQNRNLAFSFDEGANRSVVTVKDTESGDTIRQIPSEEVLRLSERIKDLQEDVGSSVGVLLNKQV